MMLPYWYMKHCQWCVIQLEVDKYLIELAGDSMSLKIILDFKYDDKIVHNFYKGSTKIKNFQKLLRDIKNIYLADIQEWPYFMHNNNKYQLTCSTYKDYSLLTSFKMTQ